MGALNVGELAPDFQFKNADGQTLTLTQQLQTKWVVLFFYPKDNTPGCTTEVCAFRDAYAVFQEAGAVVLGVSADSDQSHSRFSATHRLPFPLISDADKALRRAYRVPKTLGVLPGRMTFVIAPDRTIRMAFSSQMNAQAHPQKALALIQAAQSTTQPIH